MKLLDAVIVTTLLSASGCARQDTRLQQLAEEFESLRATTAAIGDAWLTGAVSGTYATTAFDQTFRLLDLQRTELASAPGSLVDARGARLSQAGEHLSRLIALLGEDVHRGDAEAARRHLRELPPLDGGA